MKIVHFLGGLGNQLFQYSFLLALKKQGHLVKADLSDFNHYSLHNGFELQNVFNIQIEQASAFERNLHLPTNRKLVWRALRRFSRTRKAYTYEHPEFHFHRDFIYSPKKAYLQGYWQHISYLNLVEKELRQTLQFPPITENQNIIAQSTIQNHPNTIAMHIRRGDYVGHSALGGICDQEYYHNGIKYMLQRFENPLFVIFSNDIIWCKEEFKDLNAIFIDWNTGKDSFRDMQLMSLCNHNIIANSSFSWWAAWLNQNPSKIVVSPKKWINDPTLDTSGMILPSFITF